MDFKEVVSKRRSTRRYTGKPVEVERLRSAMELALKAPSSKNTRSTRLMAVTDLKRVHALGALRDWGSSLLEEAGAAIVVMGDPEASPMWQTNAAIMATVLQLALVDEGLASCWVHVGGRPRLKDVPEGEKADDKEQVLPAFEQGEKGPHEPLLTEKQTTPPKPYTEATLLRAMETAGKTVENEELRDAMKANGIGRPSTRAAIIETLYKRNYINKVRKSLEPTPTGIALIGVIQEELLKSAELTGQWEKKLRDIEAHKYDSHQFVEELKQMVSQIVQQVMSDGTRRLVYQ